MLLFTLIKIFSVKSTHPPLVNGYDPIKFLLTTECQIKYDTLIKLNVYLLSLKPTKKKHR